MLLLAIATCPSMHVDEHASLDAERAQVRGDPIDELLDSFHPVSVLRVPVLSKRKTVTFASELASSAKA